jgi:heme exporter protein A
MDLTITSLTCLRGSQTIISGLSLSVPKGSALLLRGPNGVGKSTLLRAIAGLLPIAEGDAQIGGTSLAGDRDTYQERLAYAGHTDAIKSAFTVHENLSFWADLFDGDVELALAAFDLEEIADRRAAACSAGQKRRLGLARLAVSNRPIWLLDEPTVSLDTANALAFSAHVAKHCRGGGTAVIATHIDLDLPEATEFQLAFPNPETRTRHDPFLTGAWT